MAEGGVQHRVAAEVGAALSGRRVDERDRLAAPARLPLLEAGVARLGPAEFEPAVAGVARPADGLPGAEVVGPELPGGRVGGLELHDRGPVGRQYDRARRGATGGRFRE